MRGSRNPPAPTKNSSIRTGCWSLGTSTVKLYLPEQSQQSVVQLDE